MSIAINLNHFLGYSFKKRKPSHLPIGVLVLISDFSLRFDGLKITNTEKAKAIQKAFHTAGWENIRRQLSGIEKLKKNQEYLKLASQYFASQNDNDSYQRVEKHLKTAF